MQRRDLHHFDLNRCSFFPEGHQNRPFFRLAGLIEMVAQRRARVAHSISPDRAGCVDMSQRHIIKAVKAAVVDLTDAADHGLGAAALNLCAVGRHILVGDQKIAL